MLGKIFAAITVFGKKHNFQNNIVLRGLIPLYHSFQRLTMTRVTVIPGETTGSFANARRDNFLAENTGRVNAIAELLADEKSKKTYLGLVKFRQTGLKKDFPSKYCVKRQYFIDELRLSKEEVFVDCGAFNGDTIDAFLKHCGGYKAIVAFEPDAGNFGVLTKKYGDKPNIMPVNAGVYDKDGELLFEMRGNFWSLLVDESKTDGDVAESAAGSRFKVPVKKIDSAGIKEKVTLIKMDVEGSELKALHGAKETILRDKPKLAICIYHSNPEMVTIAEYIHQLVPEYKLYVRQHNLFPSCAETVLYAVMPD
ncbi:MAG: FkbM family methyltransferase [Chitinispirillia bacterium]|nr:FkbM family methyltransferase [Chitinispirillia bacterium]